MPELSNIVHGTEPKTYCENCIHAVLTPNTPAELSDETAVAQQGPYLIVATDDATPLPPRLPNANAPKFATSTAAPHSLASSHQTAPTSRLPNNFTVTVPITVRLPVEAFYRNFPTDVSERERRVITTNVNYEVTVDRPETRMSSNDEPLPTSYAQPINPYSSTTTKYQPTVTDKSEPLPDSAVDHYEDTTDDPLPDEQLGMTLPVEAGGREISEPISPQNAPRLVKRPSEEDVIGHNWIKFYGEEQPHASLNDSPAQMTTMQERNAPKYSRWAALRNKLDDVGKNIGEKSGESGENKLKKENKPKKQRQSRASKIFDF